MLVSPGALVSPSCDEYTTLVYNVIALLSSKTRTLLSSRRELQFLTPHSPPPSSCPLSLPIDLSSSSSSSGPSVLWHIQRTQEVKQHQSAHLPNLNWLLLQFPWRRTNRRGGKNQWLPSQSPAWDSHWTWDVAHRKNKTGEDVTALGVISPPPTYPHCPYRPASAQPVWQHCPLRAETAAAQPVISWQKGFSPGWSPPPSSSVHTFRRDDQTHSTCQHEGGDGCHLLAILIKLTRSPCRFPSVMLQQTHLSFLLLADPFFHPSMTQRPGVILSLFALPQSIYCKA